VNPIFHSVKSVSTLFTCPHCSVSFPTLDDLTDHECRRCHCGVVLDRDYSPEEYSVGHHAKCVAATTTVAGRWHDVARRELPPDADSELHSDLRAWLRDASPEDLWQVIRAISLWPPDQGVIL